MSEHITPLEASHIPLYSRIRDELRAHIFAGQCRPHDKMPSENELMTRYGVSRITVRQALSELEKEGLLFKVAGKGSYVSKPKPFQGLGRLQGFAEAMSTHGYEVYNRVLSINLLPAATPLAKRLSLPDEASVSEIKRVRFLNREPVSVDVSVISSHLGERLAREDLSTRDIFQILENDYDTPLGYADLIIDAALADNRQAELLQVTEGSPLLRIERLTHTRDGVPLVIEYLHYRADNFQLHLKIER